MIGASELNFLLAGISTLVDSIQGKLPPGVVCIQFAHIQSSLSTTFSFPSIGFLAIYWNETLDLLIRKSQNAQESQRKKPNGCQIFLKQNLLTWCFNQGDNIRADSKFLELAENLAQNIFPNLSKEKTDEA